MAPRGRPIFDAGAEGVVSPANSTGHMNRGIDVLYLKTFGQQIEDRLRERVVSEHQVRLPVGSAFAIETRRRKGRWLIVASTMIRPMPLKTDDNVHAATRAALEVAHRSDTEDG